MPLFATPREVTVPRTHGRARCFACGSSRRDVALDGLMAGISDPICCEALVGDVARCETCNGPRPLHCDLPGCPYGATAQANGRRERRITDALRARALRRSGFTQPRATRSMVGRGASSGTEAR